VRIRAIRLTGGPPQHFCSELRRRDYPQACFELFRWPAPTSPRGQWVCAHKAFFRATHVIYMKLDAESVCAATIQHSRPCTLNAMTCSVHVNTRDDEVELQCLLKRPQTAMGLVFGGSGHISRPFAYERKHFDFRRCDSILNNYALGPHPCPFDRQGRTGSSSFL
jgi:hypothetical protein